MCGHGLQRATSRLRRKVVLRPSLPEHAEGQLLQRLGLCKWMSEGRVGCSWRSIPGKQSDTMPDMPCRLQMMGRYNWTLGQQVATTLDQALKSPYTNGLHVKHVLALSPDLDLTRTRNWTEFHRVMTGLIQVTNSLC